MSRSGPNIARGLTSSRGLCRATHRFNSGSRAGSRAKSYVVPLGLVEMLERGRLGDACRARALAEMAGLSLNPDLAERAARCCKEPLQMRSPLARIGRGCIGAVVFMIGLPLAASCAKSIIPIGAIALVTLILITSRQRWCRRTLAFAAVAGLETHGDASCIDVLYNAWTSPLRPWRAARHALIQVLHRVCPADYGRLPAGGSAQIRELIWDRDTEVARASLDAVWKAGSGAMAADVKVLAATGHDETIRRYAGEVFPVLQERLRQETASSTLLRAAPASATADLLRAAAEPEPQPQELLRAVESE